MTSLETKCNIIEEFMRDNRVFYPADKLTAFVSYNDFGIPMAQAVAYNLVILTDEGDSRVEETWKNFCELLGIPADGDYDDYDDCVRKARQ
jgi:hypothetical protein